MVGDDPDALARQSGDCVTIRVGTVPEIDGFFATAGGPGIPEDERETVFDHGWGLSVTESESGAARFERRTADSGG